LAKGRFGFLALFKSQFFEIVLPDKIAKAQSRAAVLKIESPAK
jgi:hypothetical protein